MQSNLPVIATHNDTMEIIIPHKKGIVGKLLSSLWLLLFPLIPLTISFIFWYQGHEWYQRLFTDILALIAFGIILNKLVFLWRGKEILRINKNTGSIVLVRKGLMEYRIAWKHIKDISMVGLYNKPTRAYLDVSGNRKLRSGKEGEIAIAFDKEKYYLGLTLDPAEAKNVAQQIQQFVQ